MTIKDRNGKPIQKNALYKVLTINQDYSSSFDYAVVNDFSEDLDNFFLELKYERGSEKKVNGYQTYNLAQRLIFVSEEEIQNLIQDRRQRLSFLEKHAQSSPKYKLINVIMDKGDVVLRQAKPSEIGKRYTPYSEEESNYYIDNQVQNSFSGDESDC